jgi:hypothetical protein
MKTLSNRNLLKILFIVLAIMASCGERSGRIPEESKVTHEGPDLILFRRVPDTCLDPMLRQDRCSFYRECLEASITCENTLFPYAISYGEKYCNKFQAIQLKTRGEAWKRGAMLCLQEADRLVDQNGKTRDGFPDGVHASCQEVRETNFNAHVSCYLGGPARFSRRTSHTVCSLHRDDIRKIVTVVEATDALTRDSLVQIKTVFIQCVSDLKNKILGISPPGPNWPTSNLAPPAEDSENIVFLEQKIREYEAKLSGGAIAIPTFQ